MKTTEQLMADSYVRSRFLRAEILRLKREGFDTLEIARHLLFLKGVIDHWTLFFRHGRIGNNRNFQLPLP